MKSAYELAMERLRRETPSRALTDAQKAALAEIDARFEAKTAERKLALRDAAEKARRAGDEEEVAKLEERLRVELGRLEAERELEKEKVRSASS